jgi:hypothetical protein
MRTVWARGWFGLTAALVVAGLIIEIPITAVTPGHFVTAGARVANLFVYFTIEANLIVAVTSLVLALRVDRAGTMFAVWRLAGLVGITVTAVVYRTLLAGLLPETFWDSVSDELMHTAVPLLYVIGWLVWGPRGQAGVRIALLALVFPLLWTVVTLVRGVMIHWYPYPFMDVIEVGAGRVAVVLAGIAVLFLVVSCGFVAVERWLLPGRPRRPHD